jgi:predicted dehydrogenase
MGKSKPIGLGLIGCGARLRGVIRRLMQECPRAQVVGLCDPDPLSIAAARQRFGAAVPVYRTAAELCRRVEVDWVFIGSFNCHHAAHTIAAFRAGKHVFCEKPLALTLADALAMDRARRAAGRQFAFGLVLRYAPLYQQIHAWLAEGRIGRILSFEFNETLGFNHGGYIFGNWRRWRKLAGTHLLEKCCHDLDLAMWLVGDVPVRVAGFGGRNFFTPAHAKHMRRLGGHAYRTWPDPHGVNPFTAGKDIFDNQVAILEFGNGVRATFHTNCNAGIPERRFYLLGTEGAIRADACTGRIELRRIGDSADWVWGGAAGGHAGGDEKMASGLAATLAGQAKPRAGMAEGIRSLAVALAVDRATDTGRVVDLRPTWRRLQKVCT